MNAFLVDIPSISADSFLKLADYFSKKGDISLLYSASKPSKEPSYLCLFPIEKIIVEDIHTNPWDQLKEKIIDLDLGHSEPEWVGYLTYEMGAFSDKEKHIPLEKPSIPLACFQRFAITLIYQKNQLRVLIAKNAKEVEGPHHQYLEEIKKNNFWKGLLENLRSIELEAEILNKTEESTEEEYLKKIEKAKEHILSGDIYQVNISRSTFINLKMNPFYFFYELMQVNPVSYGAFLSFESHQIISASPELFLNYKNEKLTTKPIKGTIARGKTIKEDQEQKQRFLKSKKEYAELMMICDLMRNDLGRISEAGTVKVPCRAKLLTLSNVFHLESTIQSTPLKMHPIDMIRSCFPAGSITGCPKLRAMEIIHDLEKRVRHIYCGSIGYITKSGDFQFNVAIRTALYKNNQLEIQMGGAITYDSKHIDEYNETHHKGGPYYQILDRIHTKALI